MTFPVSSAPAETGKVPIPPAVTAHLIHNLPLGIMAIVYSPFPFRIVRIVLPHPAPSALARTLTGGYGNWRRGTCAATRRLSDSLRSYFAGNANALPFPDWNLLDTARLTPLQQQVLRATARIPFGARATYRDIARAVLRPRAVRFVGSALGRNPFPLLIPCHRVVRSDGTTGQFAGGKDMKRRLLALEAAAVGHPS